MILPSEFPGDDPEEKTCKDCGEPMEGELQSDGEGPYTVWSCRNKDCDNSILCPQCGAPMRITISTTDDCTIECLNPRCV